MSAPTSDPTALKATAENCVKNAKAAMAPLAPPTQFMPNTKAGNYQGELKFELQHGFPEITPITDFLKKLIDHSNGNATLFDGKDDGKALAALFRSFSQAIAAVQATLIGKERTNGGVVSVEAVAKTLLGLLDGRSQNRIAKYTFDETHTLVKTVDSLTSDLFSSDRLISKPIEQQVIASKTALPASRVKMVEREKEIAAVAAQQATLEARLDIKREIDAMLNDARAAAEDVKNVDAKFKEAATAHEKDTLTYERIKASLAASEQTAKTEAKKNEDHIQSNLDKIQQLYDEIPLLKEAVARNKEQEDKAIKDRAALEAARAESEEKHRQHMKRLTDRKDGDMALQKATKELQDSVSALLNEIKKYDADSRRHVVKVRQHVIGLVCYHDQVEHGLYSFGVTTHSRMKTKKTAKADELEAKMYEAHDDGDVDAITEIEPELEKLKTQLVGVEREYNERSAVVKGLDEQWQKSRADYESVCIANGHAPPPAAAGGPAPAPAAAAKKAKTPAPAAAKACEDKACCDDPPAYAEIQGSYPPVRVLEYEDFRVSIEAPALVWRRRQATPRKPRLLRIGAGAPGQ